MTGRAQKEYDDFVSKIRQDMKRATLEIIDEGYGENDDELEWHIRGGFKKMTGNDGFAAIVAFEVCVRAEE